MLCQFCNLLFKLAFTDGLTWGCMKEVFVIRSNQLVDLKIMAALAFSALSLK